ncbi:MAG: NAD(P)/FAD-dependent oxidoreductase [Nocardiaceae bacterium]|nr:NAD(P)/FAD-dependent oxidoreductase [Nocardiaceae bacterium]
MTETRIPDRQIVIVGAGFSGIGTLIALKKAGFDDVLALDDAAGPGGVWHWNTYPGVAVDIPSFSYQFSYEKRPNWSRTYAKGRELKGYAEHLVSKYDLAQHIRYNTSVISAHFDEAANLWRIETSGGRVSARHLIHAGGPLSRPKRPDIAGLDSFAGPTMHTARWDHRVDLRGKRVAIIGTGASAVQIIPEIARDVAHLTVFQRTPIWCMPKFDAPIPGPARWALKRVPGVEAVSRLASDAFVEATFPILAHYHKLIPGTSVLETAGRAYIKQQVKDPVVAAKLTPKYALGCKRPSFHNSYLQTFNRSNVALETGSITRISENAVHTADGVVHEVDVLILATGFKVSEKDAIPTYDLTGRGGLVLGDWWEENRLQAYQGVSSPGFPNFFTIMGPYGYNGSSFFALIENSSAHIIRCLEHARRKDADLIEVTEKAHVDYHAEMMRRRGNQIFWQESCGLANSYYFDKHGDVPLRPSLTIEAAWRSRHFPLKDYSFRKTA